MPLAPPLPHFTNDSPRLAVAATFVTAATPDSPRHSVASLFDRARRQDERGRMPSEVMPQRLTLLLNAVAVVAARCAVWPDALVRHREVTPG